MKADAAETKHSWLPVLVNDPFLKALDYRTYRFVDQLSHFDDEVARKLAKCAKHLQVQIESKIFDSLHSIQIIIFLFAIKLVWDTNAVQEVIALRLLHFS